MRLLIAILLAAAVPLASGQTIIEKAKAEQARKNAAAAKAGPAQKKPAPAPAKAKPKTVKDVLQKK
jgi:hypothetical protein